MATAAKSWAWLSDNDGWTLTNTSFNAFTRDGSNGNPAGSVYGYETGNGATGYGIASIAQTWEDLGVPAGATVTHVQLTNIDTRAGLTHWSRANYARWDVYAAFASDTLLYARGNITSQDGSWVSGSGSAIEVPAGYQASDTSITFKVRAETDNNVGSGCQTSAHFDNVEITATYTEASGDRTATGSLTVQLPLLGGSGTNTPPARSASGSLDMQLPALGGSATNVPPACSASGALALQLPTLVGTATNTPAAPRSASGGLATQLPLLGGSASNTPPARSAAGALGVQLPLLTGSATNVPPPRSAAGSLATQLPSLGGSATNSPPARSGDGGLAVQLPLFSGSATNVPPARTASGGLRVQLPSLGGSATTAEVRSAEGGLALSLPSLGGSATNTPPPRTASGGLALSLPALGGTATNTPPPRTAAGGLRVPLPSLGGAATVAEAEPRTAAGGLALSAPSLSGTAAQTYPALFFDGIDDYVPLGDLGVCEDGSFTFEAVCLPYEAEGTRYVLGESGAVARVGLGVSDGAAYARLVSDTGVVVTLTGADVTDDELHYMALAAYGGTAYLYVDGVLADSEALPAGGFSMTATTIGALAGADFWYGEVASARTYPMGLAATDIAAQYDAWLEWLEYSDNLDLTATLLPAGWAAETLRDGWTAATLPEGWTATTRSG